MGTQFGAYTLHEQLGVGARGTVHRATISDEDGGERSVAIKRIASDAIPTPEEAGSLTRRAERARQLRHPNIVRVHRVGHFEDTAYVEMELVRGVTVAELLDDIGYGEATPCLVVVSLLAELCDALEFAHRRGVVHGDITPSHLLIEPNGRLKVLGFGVASIGASRYAAPENLDGSTPDARADLFSAAAVAHELLTGRPLEGSRVPRPSQLNPRCPAALDDVLMRALAPLPGYRWPAARDMRIRLERVGGTDPEVVAAWVRGDLPSDKLPRTIALPLRAGTEPPRRVARGTQRNLSSPDDLDPTRLAHAFSIHDLPTDLNAEVDDFEEESSDFVIEEVIEVAPEPVAPPTVDSSAMVRHRPLSRRIELAIAFCLGALAMFVLTTLID